MGYPSLYCNLKIVYRSIIGAFCALTLPTGILDARWIPKLLSPVTRPAFITKMSSAVKE